MPLSLVVMALGLAGCGFLFLKAREADRKNTLKKVKEGHKSVKKAAKHVAKQPSTVIPYAPPASEEEITLSKDFSSAVAKDLAEIMEKADL